MTTIQKVALLGVRPCPNQNLFLGLTTRQKGFLGSAVLDPLVKAGFDVTVLTRCRSSVEGVPVGVAVVEVDYTSIDSLEHALRGHDAVVSTVTSAAFMV